MLKFRLNRLVLGYLNLGLMKRLIWLIDWLIDWLLDWPSVASWRCCFHRFQPGTYSNKTVVLEYYRTNEDGFRSCDFERVRRISPGLDEGTQSLLVSPEYLTDNINYFIGDYCFEHCLEVIQIFVWIRLVLGRSALSIHPVACIYHTCKLLLNYY